VIVEAGSQEHGKRILMPTYEYKCKSCEIEFERFQRISDDPITECPECGGEVQRLISTGGGLVFKGPGFYATDYGSGSSGRSGSDRQAAKEAATEAAKDSSKEASGGKGGSASAGKDGSDAGS
jgi:putative FmdB family regulatory protein